MSSENLIISLNTTNWVAGTNKYRFQFAQPLDLRGKKAELFVHQYGIYNCTFNISSKLKNNTYSIKWIDGITYNYTIQDGYYSFDQLNSVFKYNMNNDNLYLVSTTDTTKQLYYIACLTNATAYTAEIDINYFPSALPTGYSKPSNASWNMPTVNTYPQIILSSGLRTLFGFTSQTTFPLSQTVPATPKNLTFLSDTYPIISPVFNYTILCNMVNSRVSQVPTHLYSIPLTADFGHLIKNEGVSMHGVSVMPIVYNFIEIQFVDQNYNVIDLRDPELSATFILRIEDDNTNKK